MGSESSESRYAKSQRESKETKISVELGLDGPGKIQIQTGVGFFDHMLEQTAFHGRWDLNLHAEGDLHFDDHHTVEDTAIVLGQALVAIAKQKPIERYGHAIVPMDEALVMVALDFSGRSILAYDVPFVRERIGELATENIREFFRALAAHAGLTLHIRKMAGENDHHVAEAVFKAFGQAVRQALRASDRAGAPSTKGMLD